MEKKMPQPKNLGTENARWDLGIFYSGINDPQIDADLENLQKMARNFNDKRKSKLATELGAAIQDYSEINMLTNKIFAYLFLLRSTNLTDEAVKTKSDSAQRIWDAASGEFLTFFDLEIIALDQAAIDRQAEDNPTVKKHLPWLKHLRIFKPHVLSEAVESALAKRNSYGASSWSEFFDEAEADLRFQFQGEEKTLEEMLDIINNDPNADVRAKTLSAINAGLGQGFAKYAAQTLNMIIGEKTVEDRERNYPHPMTARNMGNRVPDAVVEALHKSVSEIAAPYARRYYRLKAKMLGLKCLRWSDRNAPLPWNDTSTMPFDEARKIVVSAYESLSPTLGALVQKMDAEKRVDAPSVKGKKSGAYNYSVILPGNMPVSFILMNYLGSNRDVMMLAHESGHAVHGLLVGEAQGVIMQNAPTAYAETASVFGEMTTFNYLKDKLLRDGNKKALLAFLCGKIDDLLNTSVRQISFSEFERRAHGMKKRLSPEEFSQLWQQVTREFYGENGDAFTYENMSLLWSYVPHFHHPFYVYGYAFGEFLTQSLYAQRNALGDKFEPLYLDLLRAGGTKDIGELLRPFGLNPADPEFWSRGIINSLDEMVKSAEALYPDIRN